MTTDRKERTEPEEDATRSEARTGERALSDNGLGLARGVQHDPQSDESPSVLAVCRHGEKRRALGRLTRVVHMFYGRVEWRRRA